MAIDRNARARMQFSQKMADSKAPAEEPGLLEGEEGAATEGQEAAAPQEALTPDERKTLEQSVQAAGKMLYSEKVSRSIASMIEEPPHTDAIGDSAAQIVKAVDDKLDVPEQLIIPLGLLVAEMVSDLGEELGFYKETEEFVNKCVQATLKKLYEIYGTDEQELAVEAEGYTPDQLRAGMPMDEEPTGGEPPAEEPGSMEGEPEPEGEEPPVEEEAE